MITLEGEWSPEVAAARERLISTLDELVIPLPVLDDLRPLPRAKATPLIDGMIRLIQTSVTQEVDRQAPVMLYRVQKQVGSVSGSMLLATAATGVALAGLLIAAAKWA